MRLKNQLTPLTRHSEQESMLLLVFLSLLSTNSIASRRHAGQSAASPYSPDGKQLFLPRVTEADVDRGKYRRSTNDDPVHFMLPCLELFENDFIMREPVKRVNTSDPPSHTRRAPRTLGLMQRIRVHPPDRILAECGCTVCRRARDA